MIIKNKTKTKHSKPKQTSHQANLLSTTIRLYNGSKALLINLYLRSRSIFLSSK